MRAAAWLALCACASAAGARRVRRADDDDDGFSLDPTVNQIKPCKTNTGLEGICIDESMCDEAHVFHPGGIIDDSEIRAKQCAGRLEWCCSFMNSNVSALVPTTNTTTSAERTKPPGCGVAQKDSCPWCVGLYRSGGNPRTRAPSGLFCGGAAVGTRAVLTAASCALAAGAGAWVQRPGSSRRYAVDSSASHDQFSSGTREHDVALLLLKEELAEPGGAPGACLGLRTPLAGSCVALGFDASDRLVFTPVAVSDGACSAQGATPDAACGRAAGACAVVSGTPVLCPADSGELVVAGVARQACAGGAALLGALAPSADWLRAELARRSLPADHYTL